MKTIQMVFNMVDIDTILSQLYVLFHSYISTIVYCRKDGIIPLLYDANNGFIWILHKLKSNVWREYNYNKPIWICIEFTGHRGWFIV